MCMWAPQLLSYCDPILVHGVGGNILRRQTTETQRLFIFSFYFIFSLQPPPSQATSLTCAHHFTLRPTAELAWRRHVHVYS